MGSGGNHGKHFRPNRCLILRSSRQPSRCRKARSWVCTSGAISKARNRRLREPRRWAEGGKRVGLGAGSLLAAGRIRPGDRAARRLGVGVRLAGYALPRAGVRADRWACRRWDRGCGHHAGSVPEGFSGTGQFPPRQFVAHLVVPHRGARGAECAALVVAASPAADFARERARGWSANHRDRGSGGIAARSGRKQRDATDCAARLAPGAGSFPQRGDAARSRGHELRRGGRGAGCFGGHGEVANTPRAAGAARDSCAAGRAAAAGAVGARRFTAHRTPARDSHHWRCGDSVEF